MIAPDDAARDHAGMLLGLHTAGAGPACVLLGLSSASGEPFSSGRSSTTSNGEAVAELALPSRPAHESVQEKNQAQRWTAAKAVEAASLAGPSAGGAAAGTTAAGGEEGEANMGGKRRAQVAAHPRKEWSSAEDELIRHGVQQLGYKWRVIAAQLPGRSDDAVRNRWSRLQEVRGHEQQLHTQNIAAGLAGPGTGGSGATAAGDGSTEDGTARPPSGGPRPLGCPELPPAVKLGPKSVAGKKERSPWIMPTLALALALTLTFILTPAHPHSPTYHNLT